MSGAPTAVAGPTTTHIDESPNNETSRINQHHDEIQETCWTRFTHSFRLTFLTTNTIHSGFRPEVIDNNHTHKRARRRLKRKRGRGTNGRNGHNIPLVTTSDMNNGYNSGINNTEVQATQATHTLGQTPTLAAPGSVAGTRRRATGNRLRKSRRQTTVATGRENRTRQQRNATRSSSFAAVNNGSIANDLGLIPAGEGAQPGTRATSTHTASRNLTPATTPTLEQLVPWSSQLRKPVEPFPRHLPDDILRTIFEFAAVDLDTACSLTLVASHVKLWVDPLLYRRVRLEGVVAIGLFARTVREAFASENEAAADDDGGDKVQEPNTGDPAGPHAQPILPHQRARRQIRKRPSFFTNVYSLSIIPQEERVLLFFRDILRDAILILFACSNLVELETSGDFLRRTGVKASVELTQPAPSPVPPAAVPANTIPDAASTPASTSTSNIAITAVPTILGSGSSAFPHTGSPVNAAISAEIGSSGTVPTFSGNDSDAGEHGLQSSTPIFHSAGPPTPTNLQLTSPAGVINTSNTGHSSTDPTSLISFNFPVTSAAASSPDTHQIQLTSHSAEFIAPLSTANPSPIPTPSPTNTRTSIFKALPTQQWLQLEQAALRPQYLTLVPPTLNVNFKLPILSNVTHLHYSAALPRALNAFRVGEGLNFDPATGGVNVSGGSTGKGTSLQFLTHVAFDYPLGVTGVKAETLLVLIRSALDVGKPLGWENEGQQEEDAGNEDEPNGNEDDRDPSQEQNKPLGEQDGDETPPTASEIPSRRRLKMVVVRILLRPRMKADNDRTGEVWRQLSDLSARDERLVFFDSPNLFGEDIWEKANAVVAARDSGRLSTSWYRESP